MSSDTASDVYAAGRTLDAGPAMRWFLGGLAWVDDAPSSEGGTPYPITMPSLWRPPAPSGLAAGETRLSALAHRPERIIGHRVGGPATSLSAQWHTWTGAAWTAAAWPLTLLPRGSAEDEYATPGWPSQPPGGWAAFDFFPYLPASFSGDGITAPNPWARLRTAPTAGAPSLLGIVRGVAYGVIWLWYDRPVVLGPAAFDVDAIKVGALNVARAPSMPFYRPATHPALPNLVRAPMAGAATYPSAHAIKAGYVASAADGAPSAAETVTPSTETEGCRVWRPRMPSRGPIGRTPSRPYAGAANLSGRTLSIGSDLVTPTQAGDPNPRGVLPASRVAASIPSGHTATPRGRLRPGRANVLSYDHGHNQFPSAAPGAGTGEALRAVALRVEAVEILADGPYAGRELLALTAPSLPTDRAIVAALRWDGIAPTFDAFYNLYVPRLSRGFFAEPWFPFLNTIQRSGAVPVRAGDYTDGHLRVMAPRGDVSYAACGIVAGDVVTALLNLHAALPRDRAGVWPVPHLTEAPWMANDLPLNFARIGGDFSIVLKATIYDAPPQSGGVLLPPASILSAASGTLYSRPAHSLDFDPLDGGVDPATWNAEFVENFLSGAAPTYACGGAALWVPGATYYPGDTVLRELVPGSGYAPLFYANTTTTADPLTSYAYASSGADWQVPPFGAGTGWRCDVVYPARARTRRYADQPRQWATRATATRADGLGLPGSIPAIYLTEARCEAACTPSGSALIYDATGPADQHWPGCVPNLWLPPGGWAT